MDMKRQVACALMIAALSTPAFAQSAASTPAAATSSDPRQEGVKVHGDWTLTVRNPDGTVAAVHEFKNALSIGAGADQRLASLLGGEAVPGHWVIGFGLTPSNGCGGVGCFISEVPLSFSHSTNLTKSIATGGLDVGKLVLQGSVRMVNAASIILVITQLTTCAGTTSPDTCAAANYSEFTRRFLPQGIAVSGDQLVEVKVVISFS